MFFEYSLTIPANTPATAPVETEAFLAPGTVSRVDVQFPRGCVSLVQVQIWRSEHQVWPVNLDGSISGENAIVSWDEDYDLDDEPFAFTLRGWSAGTAFEHTITFRFALMPLEAKEEQRASAGLLRRLAEAFFGRS